MGAQRNEWKDSPAVTEYMGAFRARQDTIKDSALQYVYEVMEEEHEEFTHALMALACDSDHVVQRDALWLLSVLFLDPKYFQSILNQGGMRALVLLSCGLHEDVQLICARAMVRIALDKELLMEVQDDSPVCGILLLCDSKSAEVRRSAT